MSQEDKDYFCDMVAIVNEKLTHCQEGSLIKEYFPDTRLKEIKNKIARSDAKDLEWATWQPLFLFLRDASEAEINALDGDLRMVSDRTPQGESQVCKFLVDEGEAIQPWISGLFEVYAKAALLKSDLLSVDMFDCKLPNSRNIDAKVRIGKRMVGVEITTRGETIAAMKRWGYHCKEVLAENRDQAFCESQDAYAPGRWLYGTAYNKLAPDFDTSRSQLLPDAPNLLLISLSNLISDLTPTSPAIGWALDELLASQPSQNTSPISLKEWLRSRPKLQDQSDDTIMKLLHAPSQISGVLLFDSRCMLQIARINDNAREAYRITHEEMECFKKVLTYTPAYCC